MNQNGASSNLNGYSLLDALLGRRSRRFGLGMSIPHGPLAYKSQHEPVPLTEAEEAALVFAATGITGYSLRDLSYGSAQGGTMIAGSVSRTISSADSINTVPLFVTNDEATYLIKRPQDFMPAEIPELLEMARKGALVELYRRMRVKIKDGRAAPPLDPPINFIVNHWSLYARGGTYFLPINDLTYFYINGLMEMLEVGMELFVVDERANFQPAGLARFGRSKGGRLYDRPEEGRTVPISAVEFTVAEMVTIEQGMMLQNLGLMAQALGLGAWPNFARHESGWFEALGFTMGHMPGSRYLGANPLITAALGLLKRDPDTPYPLGLERDGDVLIKPFCPPYYPSMRAAVEAVVEIKFGKQGVFRGQAKYSTWRDPGRVEKEVARVDDSVIEATIAYCEYIYNRYGRFPAYIAPFRSVLGYQVTHVDTDFYDKFYQPEALTSTQREHMARWHPPG
jgi:hypothetical protein